MRWHWKLRPALIVPLPALVTPLSGIFDILIPLPVNRLPNKLAPSVPGSIKKSKYQFRLCIVIFDWHLFQLSIL